ncbi:MAG: M24 family metallopeptidase [Lentisphaeria bacterium]|jgi:Xaa-Pro aminopeptidase|nr:M24 family metallopeptidase [Lentisphaeria bacterium]
MDGIEIDGLDFSRIRRIMKDEQIDALVAMEPHTTAILLNDWNKIFIDIGFREAPAAVVFLASGKTLAVSPRLNQRMENAPWIEASVGRYTDSTYYDQRPMVDALARVLRQNGLENARIGFEMGFVPAGIMDWIIAELPAIELVDGEWILWQFRAAKSPKQIGFIQTAVDACEAGVKKMLDGWEEGKSIHTLLDEFEQVVKDRGADFFCTYQRALAKKWAPFAGRDQRFSEEFIIMENDDQEVLFDLIVTCQAYVSDWKRSFYLGTPPKEIADLYEFEWRIVQTLVQELKPGMTTIEAYTACDERLKKDGLVNWWCIHSVGLEIHEEPLIGGSPMVSENGDVDMTATARFPGLLRDGSEKITFEPNQVVMVETKKVEDPYLITTEGLQRLNTLPQKLFVV